MKLWLAVHWLVRQKMKLSRPTNRQFAYCLNLSAVLILGIVQWSFLPVLIQNAPLASNTQFEVSPGHSAKFAAPFKGLVGESLKPRQAQSLEVAPLIAENFFLLDAEPAPGLDDQFFSHRQLRSPPSI
jgi:hypothetical protein